MKTIGIISDTHGLVRPQALKALEGCGLVLHAGDVGGADVLDALAAVAPVVAVRGNTDRGAWCRRIPATQVVELNPWALYVLHDLAELDLDPLAAGLCAVISGHSHRPKVETRGGVLYVNPGSAGPRRFGLPLSVARLTLTDKGPAAEIIEL